MGCTTKRFNFSNHTKEVNLETQSSVASEEMSKKGSVLSLVMSEVIMLFHRDLALFYE